MSAGSLACPYTNQGALWNFQPPRHLSRHQNVVFGKLVEGVMARSGHL